MPRSENKSATWGKERELDVGSAMATGFAGIWGSHCWEQGCKPVPRLPLGSRGCAGAIVGIASPHRIWGQPRRGRRRGRTPPLIRVESRGWRLKKRKMVAGGGRVDWSSRWGRRRVEGGSWRGTQRGARSVRRCIKARSCRGSRSMDSEAAGCAARRYFGA